MFSMTGMYLRDIAKTIFLFFIFQFCTRMWVVRAFSLLVPCEIVLMLTAESAHNYVLYLRCLMSKILRFDLD